MLQSIDDGSATENPNLLNQFLLLSFAVSILRSVLTHLKWVRTGLMWNYSTGMIDEN